MILVLIAGREQKNNKEQYTVMLQWSISFSCRQCYVDLCLTLDSIEFQAPFVS
jgi:hypothetical protein